MIQNICKEWPLALTACRAYQEKDKFVYILQIGDKAIDECELFSEKRGFLCLITFN
jgi:hypothetical protein